MSRRNPNNKVNLFIDSVLFFGQDLHNASLYTKSDKGKATIADLLVNTSYSTKDAQYNHQYVTASLRESLKHIKDQWNRFTPLEKNTIIQEIDTKKETTYNLYTKTQELGEEVRELVKKYLAKDVEKPIISRLYPNIKGIFGYVDETMSEIDKTSHFKIATQNRLAFSQYERGN